MQLVTVVGDGVGSSSANHGRRPIELFSSVLGGGGDLIVVVVVGGGTDLVVDDV